MDLLRSWLVAIVVLVAAAVATAFAAITLATPDWLDTSLGAAVFSGGSAFVGYGLATGLAGFAHRTKRRDAKIRIRLAVFPVPVLALLAGLVADVLRGGPMAAIISGTLLGAAGVAAGWAGVRALKGRSSRHLSDAAYRY